MSLALAIGLKSLPRESLLDFAALATAFAGHPAHLVKFLRDLHAATLN